MPIHPFKAFKGRLEYLTVRSKYLANNMLGDPDHRSVAVYLPPGYENSKQQYPLFTVLAGFTGSGLKHLNWSSFGESLPQRLDRLVDEQKI